MAEQEVFDASRLTEQSKVVSLFQFIQELNKLKQKAVLDYTEYPWHFTLSSLPNDPDNIRAFNRDRVEEENISTTTDSDNVLLSVHKPEFQRCPEPNPLFKDWLLPGWDDFRKPVYVRESISSEEKDFPAYKSLFGIPHDQEGSAEPESIIIYFSDFEERTNAYDNWLNLRTAWVEKQKRIKKTLDLFTDLYRIYYELQRESETEEIIVANGILCDRDNPDIKHPVLTHRVKLDYDADKNTVFIMDTEVPSELYSPVFTVFENKEGFNLNSFRDCNDDLQKNDYHPLDTKQTPAFLKVLVHQLTFDSYFSESGMPENWSNTNRLLLYVEPCYILRKRLDGTVKAIGKIIENIKETGEVPKPIRDIVIGGKIDIPKSIGEESIEEQLAAVGGESVDILLSKKANKEQLEIARRIENYNAVLVQGPPGTGKTHTIANLMGHFFAQGKSVLVTSHTTKALSVLKDKVDERLRNLCVSMLDDSHEDMENSVDGILSYMSTDSDKLKQEMDRIAEERQAIIDDLAKVRQTMFTIIKQECECIVYNGEGISPTEAAKFVLRHADNLSYIPGTVQLYAPMPLTLAQLTDLYRSNEAVSVEDEIELANDLPIPEQIMAPSVFSTTWDARQRALHEIEAIAEQHNWTINNNENERWLNIHGPFGDFSVQYPNVEAVQELKNYAQGFGKIEQWMKAAAVDGKNSGSFRQLWLMLIDQIQKTKDYAESVRTEQTFFDIRFLDDSNIEDYKAVFEKLCVIFDKNSTTTGQIGLWNKLFHKEYNIALNAVTINGNQAKSAKDCEVILHCMELETIRKQCAALWDKLLVDNGVRKFFDLDAKNPELIAGKWIPGIQRYLDWYQDAYQPLLDKLAAVGIPSNIIFGITTLDSDIDATDKILFAIENVIPAICDIFLAAIKAAGYALTIDKTESILRSGKRGGSRVCTAILSSIEQGNIKAYADVYAELEHMYEKYALQSNRIEMLKTLEPIAPQWAEAIRDRKGIHGQSTVPSDIEEAWKWKQLCGIVAQITEKSFESLQADSLRLSEEYRDITARYAATSAWYHLIRRTKTDISIQQALAGWKLTIQQIGKGTGKDAPHDKAKARELMAKCQNAVPGWIMPINRALESLNPKKNRFDIVIIDEASQSDISSLAILYLGRKLIIVGDDKQVSPMAVGVDGNQLRAKQKMYIKGKIPNAHLYNATTSIYDIAATTFPRLMLKEHFRCVPEIIGFSNMLSYNYKIKPLREASSSILLPAVVNYRVDGGQRISKSKTNPKEARAIIALMKACMEQPEYAGKSFGVISLLGNEGDQVKLISQLIDQEIDPKERKQRNILCGNSAHFQGDERDVIFLSMVDSNNTINQLSLMGFGNKDAYRKRYNVAASRARDQLWVVDSLDPANDLKHGDLRKMLIDYSINPQASAIAHAKVQNQAQSPFEVAVATTLIDRGYHLVQQWEVGSYRLDIVAICGKEMVAIECDGERWHSSEAQIRKDMERQTILERIGWRFIRIRGSEYYRHPEETMKRVISKLTEYGIEPEMTDGVPTSEGRETELLRRVKSRAAIILSTMTGEDDLSKATIDNIIEGALNPNSIMPDNMPQVIKANPIKATSNEPSAPSEGQNIDSKSKTANVPTEDTTTTSRPKETKSPNPTPTSNPPVTVPPPAPIEPIQMTLPGFEATTPKAMESASNPMPKPKGVKPNEEDIIAFLKKYNVRYVDKRPSGGSLWIIGGHELDSIVSMARNRFGIIFQFTKGGGKATKHKDGWYAK